MASAWPTGGGKTGALLRALDWTHTPFGSPESWPPSLRSVVSLLLDSKFPMFLAWGPQLGLIYNDAYTEILGEKHPEALGAPFREVWAEIWSDLWPLIEAALRGEATYSEDLPLVMNRYGYDEQTWFTFSYSPIEEGDKVAGMFCAVVETTGRVRDAEQRAFLAEFDDRVRDLEDADEILLTCARLLGEHLGVDRVHWVEIDDARGLFHVRHEWTQPGVPSIIGDHRIGDFSASLVATMRAGGLVAVEDLAQGGPDAVERVGRAFGVKQRGALGAPLLRGGEWQASLGVHTIGPRRWREDERRLIREVAERGWTRAQRARAEARVRESEQRLRALVNGTSDIIFRVSADWTELRELEGRGRPETIGKRNVEWIEAFLPPEEQLRLHEAINRALTAEDLFEFEHRFVRPDGADGWMRAWAVPLRDAAGRITEWFGAARDVTEARRARQELEETAERLQLATEAAEIGFWDLDPITDALILSPRVKQIFDLPPEGPIFTADFNSRVHIDDEARVAEAFAAAMDPERRALYDVELRAVGRDGRVRWVAAKGRGIFDDAGRCVRLIGTAIDITVRKAAEAHLRLMVNELNHRVKNSLATVQAITVQTLRRGVTSDEVREALVARLVALAEAHDVLTDAKWSGAELAELAAQAAAPYVSLSGASPFEIRGPSVFLPPKTAIAMALAFHELATNAAKYGALSRPDGKVLIVWRVTTISGGRALHLTWRERGGPEVRPPEHTGFGTRLIQRGLASELQGEVVLDFRPTGLVCTVEAHLPNEPIEGWMADLQPS